MDLMIRLKEFQRRMDQVLGQPKTSDRDNRARYTINARIARIEDHITGLNEKIDECVSMLQKLIENSENKNTNRLQSLTSNGI
jgi:hypothetical protein